MDWFSDFNINLFHFMRPQWLWLLLPLFAITLFIFLTKDAKANWKKVIEPHLLPYMVSKASKLTFLAPALLFVVVLSLMIVVAAGPTWRKIDVPGAKSEAVLLIALDLSPSMLVEDVSPNRLERAKFKIRDLLEANPGAKVGLLAFAGTCHPVVTPCNDYQLITHQIEALIPQIMPVQGTNYKHLLAAADTILNRTEAPSTLMIVTDNIDKEQAELIKSVANNSKNSVEILTLATTHGGRIPGLRRGTFFKKNGEYVISKLDQNVLFDLQKHEKININLLTMDSEDMQVLAKKVKKNLIHRSKDNESEETWEEMGFALLWIGLIIFVFWFRKGWMIQWCFVLFTLSSCNQEVKSWEDLWYTKNYQGQQAMDKLNYELASENYESTAHKGVAYYKAGDFEAAIEVFKQDTNAQSIYNLGLAYAANGQNNMANEALLLAQNLDPKNETITSTLKNNQNILMQIDSLRTFNPDSAMVLEKKKGTEKLEERKAKGKDEELSADNEVKELPKYGKRVTDEQETGTRKAEEMETPPEDFIGEKTDNAQDVLLREISADPSEFLKRRFKFQQKKYYNNEPEPKELW